MCEKENKCKIEDCFICIVSDALKQLREDGHKDLASKLETTANNMTEEETGLSIDNEMMQELLSDAMEQSCSRDHTGVWLDSMAISTWRDIGNKLSSLGLYERQEGGHGRRWFYRRIQK